MWVLHSIMTEQEMQWFDALSKDRMESADTLEKPSMRGVQRSVVDKYSDQAHFIYELLQNADDVKATSARFRLEKDGLFFTHNGSIPFAVSNPENESADTNSGVLGHINSITSIANSNKTEASIGKFGVGFKAVFQYTQTPHIYDPKIWFKIERFIVPRRLDVDLDSRKPSETAFFFPFDHKGKQPQECHDEILEKLKALEFPVLFLTDLKSVSFEAEEVTGKYSKKVTRELVHGAITVKWLTLALELNGGRTAHRLLVFTLNSTSGHPCSIGYALSKDGKLDPIDRPAFCFFPTKEVTNLNFIVHAPFLLTDSREGIKAGEVHNRELVQQLGQLAADSLPILRDQGLINDSILDIIPYDEARFSSLDDRHKISFKPFFTAIKDKLQIDTLLPAANGECSSKSQSYWASDSELVELFSDKQLAQLTGTANARWVFRSLGKKNTEKNPILANYIDGGDARE
ncbi:MAG: DNA helicase, partial [Acidobacteria bacterium]|nr:DNA helicase [Acidobacteriota bacterium]